MMLLSMMMIIMLMVNEENLKRVIERERQTPHTFLFHHWADTNKQTNKQKMIREIFSRKTFINAGKSNLPVHKHICLG